MVEEEAIDAIKEFFLLFPTSRAYQKKISTDHYATRRVWVEMLREVTPKEFFDVVIQWSRQADLTAAQMCSPFHGICAEIRDARAKRARQAEQAGRVRVYREKSVASDSNCREVYLALRQVKTDNPEEYAKRFAALSSAPTVEKAWIEICNS